MFLQLLGFCFLLVEFNNEMTTLNIIAINQDFTHAQRMVLN